MKTTWILVPTAIVALLLAICYSGRFVHFEPLKLQQGSTNKLIPAPELVTPEYLRRVRTVLEFYGQPYRTNATGRLLIKATLAGDKELVWNYSNKALDDAFIEQARKFKTRQE